MSLKDYRVRIKAAAEKRDGTPVYNGSIDHAAVLAETMFEYANDHVFILSEKMNARVYGTDEVIEQAKLFLADPSHSVRVLVENKDAQNAVDHPFFETFKDHKNVEFHAINDDLQKLYDFHFLCMDGDSYRFEKDKREPSAIAAFGDVDGAANLEMIYTSLWEQSEPLDLRD